MNRTRPAAHRGWILLPNQLLAGNYRIYDKIGTSGGMGQVFAAEDIALRRKVAIKVPSLNILEQPGGAERFLHEARAANRLDGSPHIVKIIAYLTGHTGDSPEPLPFIVMEYLGGGNLTGRLRNGPMTLQDVVTFFSQICSALSFAHAKGVVHRDLKPENICFDDSGRLVIVDFGIARMLGESYTATMSIAGTAAYMAPEQWNPALGVDHRTDLYAAGVLLFQMLTGRLPFEGTPDQMCIAHLKQTPPNVCEVRRDIPSAIGAAIRRAMEKDKEQRHQSAAEFDYAVRVANVGPVDVPPESKFSTKPAIGSWAKEAQAHIEKGEYSAAFDLLHKWAISGKWDPEAAKLLDQAYCTYHHRFVGNRSSVFWEGRCPDCRTPLVFGEDAQPGKERPALSNNAAGQAPNLKNWPWPEKPKISVEAEALFKAATEQARSGMARGAAKSCLAAIRAGHPNAMSLKHHIMCSQEQKTVSEPSFHSNSGGYGRYWNGQCPDCGAPLMLPKRL